MTLPELATRLRRTTATVQKMRLPACVRIAGKRLWFRSDVEDLFLPDTGYRDELRADELAAALHCSVPAVYILIRRGILPKPGLVNPGRRARWSRRDVEQHLRAQLPRRAAAVNG